MDTLRKFPIQEQTKLNWRASRYRSRGRAGLCLSVWRERVDWGLYRFPPNEVAVNYDKKVLI